MRRSFVPLLFLAGGCQGSTDPASQASITISPAAATISVGQSLTLVPTLRDAAGQMVSNGSVNWSSTDVGAATVTGAGNGTAIAVGAGASTISASSGGVVATVLVRVVGITPAKASVNGEQIWLGPNKWTGLYAAGAAWTGVQARTHVVKLYVDAIATAPAAELTAAVATLDQAHIAVAVEVGGVRDWNCSGASMAVVERAKIDHYLAAGGAISFLDMDSPFGHGMVNTIPGNCGFTMRQVATELIAYIHAMRIAYPGVKIGLIEPVPWYSVGTYRPNPGNDFGDLPTLLDTLTVVLSAAGEQIDYFHADSPYDYDQAHPNGWPKLVALAAAVRSHGLRFGLILNSDAGGQAGDQPFHDQTLAAFTAFGGAGGRSDDLMVQSWYPYPGAMAPEGTAFTFTNTARDLVARYDGN